MKRSLSITLLTAASSLFLTACDPESWPGAGSDLSVSPQVGGDINASGSHFGGWVNNAWGENSRLFPTYKDHPPLQGVKVCVNEQPELPCAITDATGRYDIYGISSSYSNISISLDGYYKLSIPFDASQGSYPNHPAVELPSHALQEQLYSQVNSEEISGKGSMNFFAVDNADLVADDNAYDHAESAGTLKGVAFKYRRVYIGPSGYENYGSWSDPRSYNIGREIVYLNSSESPDLNAMHTSSSGLALALNLEPGVYEVAADDTNFFGGFATKPTLRHYDCKPVNKSPSGEKSKYARATVIAGHLADVRMVCD